MNQKWQKALAEKYFFHLNIRAVSNHAVIVKLNNAPVCTNRFWSYLRGFSVQWRSVLKIAINKNANNRKLLKKKRRNSLQWYLES